MKKFISMLAALSLMFTPLASAGVSVNGNGGVFVNGVDVSAKTLNDLTITGDFTHTMSDPADHTTITQSSAVGTEGQPLQFINDDRTGATANSKEEATTVWDAEGRYAGYVMDGEWYFTYDIDILASASLNFGPDRFALNYRPGAGSRNGMMQFATTQDLTGGNMSAGIPFSRGLTNWVTEDFNGYLSPSFIMSNEEGADNNDHAYVVMGERTQADIAVTHYFDFFAGTGAWDAAVDGTTTEIPASFRFGSQVYTDMLIMETSTGLIEGTGNATQNTHHEIGDLLGVLTSPVAIVGFTGTGADSSTETGYENGAGRVWTYHDGLTTDKIFQGQTYVYSFDGTDSYMSTPDTADMSFGDASNDSAMSIGGWIEVVDTGAVKTIISKWDETTASEFREWRVRFTNGELLGFEVIDESANASPYIFTDAALSVGWHFITVTYDGTGGADPLAGGNCVIYVDGVAPAQTAAAGPGAYVAMENTATLPFVGAITGASALSHLYSGDMGRLFVTPEELSAAKIWQLYEKTRGNYNK